MAYVGVDEADKKCLEQPRQELTRPNPNRRVKELPSGLSGWHHLPTQHTNTGNEHPSETHRPEESRTRARKPYCSRLFLVETRERQHPSIKPAHLLFEVKREALTPPRPSVSGHPGTPRFGRPRDIRAPRCGVPPARSAPGSVVDWAWLDLDANGCGFSRGFRLVGV